MNIRELISAVDRYQELSEAKPKVKQDASGNWVDAETGEPVQPAADNTVEFPKQAGAQAQPEAPAQPAAEPAAPSPTGDATLDQPLPPKDSNAPGFATKFGRGVGQFAKGVGAVAGGVAGIGRAMKKGYQAGASTVGGPGSAPAAGRTKGLNKFAGAGQPAAQQSGSAGSKNVDSELADLRQMINRVDAKLAKAGIKQ